MNLDIAYLKGWIGNTEELHDLVGAAPLIGLSATLDRDDPLPVEGAPVPPLWHWLYFLPAAMQSELGSDGHPKRGGFLPPVPLPRRMWAGGRLQFIRPLRVGQAIVRSSRILDISVKEGRSGSLVCVTVRHEIANPAGVAITEEHDIVYRDQPAPDTPVAQAPEAPRNEDFSREIVPDPVLLFRYSALTFNGHRIHYDRSYVTGVEHYPGLIVHGPLIATLLVDLVRRKFPGRSVSGFEFKAISPLFDLDRFSVCGRIDETGHAELWARHQEGGLAMRARATLM